MANISGRKIKKNTTIQLHVFNLLNHFITIIKNKQVVSSEAHLTVSAQKMVSCVVRLIVTELSSGFSSSLSHLNKSQITTRMKIQKGQCLMNYSAQGSCDLC